MQKQQQQVVLVKIDRHPNASWADFQQTVAAAGAFAPSYVEFPHPWTIQVLVSSSQATALLANKSSYIARVQVVGDQQVPDTSTQQAPQTPPQRVRQLVCPGAP